MTDHEGFYREVDEDYRRDQTLAFLKRYGVYMVAAGFVAVAVVAGYTIEKTRRANKAESGGDTLTNAILLTEAGKQDEAARQFAALARSGPSNYRVLARLQEAANAIAKSQSEDALALYRGVAGDEAAPQAFRDFAALQAAALSVDTENYDTLSKQLAQYRSGVSPWRYSAKEILGLAAYKDGRQADAERLYGEIVSDGAAPQTMRQRAEMMLALLLQNGKTAQADATGKGTGGDDAKTQ